MLFNILRVVLTVVEVVVCFLLITAILIQKSKTQGAGLAFGAGVGETLFGGQIGNVMTKITVVLAVIFLLNTTALTFMAVKAKYHRPVDRKAVPEMPVGGPGTALPTDMAPSDMVPVEPGSAVNVEAPAAPVAPGGTAGGDAPILPAPQE